MAKSVDVRDFRYSIYINNEQAGKSVSELRSKLDGLKNELKDVESKGGEGTQYWKDLKQEISGLNKELLSTKKSAGVAGLSIKELRSLKKQAVSIRNDLDPVSEEFKEWNQFIKQCDTRMEELNVTSKKVETTIQEGTGGMKKYWGAITAGAAAVAGAVYSMEQLTEKADKMDDVYADVMKTTGMTREQVVDLNEDFKKIDTRTSREQLNMLAADAGKLGISAKEDVLGFVDAGNQIRVALDDLGEDAIKDIGKMADVYKKSTIEIETMDMKGKLLAVGSAVNELGSASNANEKYLVEYTQRMGGVASQAGLSIQEILGFASAADQSGQKMEMATTALQVFITKLMEDPAKFAKLAGEDVKEFTNLLKTDANAAIVKVLTSMNERGGFSAMIPIFKEMKLDGSGAINVLSGLAANIDKVKDAQDLANTAFSEATSLTSEYNVKNNNRAAQTEKQKKQLEEIYITLGEKLQPVMLQTRGTLISVLESMLKVHGALEGSKTTLKVVAVAIGVYTLAVKGAWLESKLLAFWNTQVLTGLKRVQLAMINNPMAAYTLGISLVIAALIDLRRNMNNVSAEQKRMNDISQDVHRNTANEVRDLEMLKKTLFDSSKGYDERKMALDKIKEIVPGYHASLTTEGKLINNNSDALDTYVKKLKLAAQIQSVSGKLTDAEANMKSYLSELGADAGKYANIINRMNSPMEEGKTPELIAIEEGLSPVAFKAIQRKREMLQHEIDIYKGMLEQYSADMGKIAANNSDDPLTPKPGGGDDPEALKEKLKSIETVYKQQQIILKEALQNKQITQEQYEKLMAEQELSYLEVRKQTLLDFGKDTTDIQLQQLDKLIAETNRRSKKLKLSASPEEEEELDTSNDALLKKFQNSIEGQLSMNQALYDAKLIQAEEYEQKKSNLERAYREEKVKDEQKAAELISGIASTAASLFSAMQQREVASIKAKYDRQIELAGDNSEKVKELEEKQAAEIAEIQSQYADRQFAMTAIGIIADTAAGVMKTYAEYGMTPWGIAASAAMTVQGAMQLAIAQQQRDAAKQQGYYKGGFTSEGDPTEEAGVVHKNEFVANHKAVRNPHVKKFLDVFDIAQKDGSISMLNTSQILQMVTGGFYGGGYATSSNQSPILIPTNTDPDNDIIRQNIRVMEQLMALLKAGISVNVPIAGSNGIDAQLKKYQQLQRNISRG